MTPEELALAQERLEALEREVAARAQSQRRLARIEDYRFDKAQEKFWDIKNGTLHSEKAVDASIPQELWRRVEEPAEDPATPRGRGRPRTRDRLVRPSLDIARVENDLFVESSIWWPGQPAIVDDWLITENGLFRSKGARLFNLYKPPPEPVSGVSPADAAPWVAHVKRLWPDPVTHSYFFDYCAHMVQRPGEKCHGAIVLSGEQGIGKDAALWPVKAALGSWNFKDISPDQLFTPYQPFYQSLMLVVNEVRPTSDENHASSLYNILKPLAAAPPDTLPVNDKFTKLRYVVNVVRVFLTTNNYMDMHVPPGDRRIFLMHSTVPKGWHIADGDPDYFVKMFEWLFADGWAAVNAWLMARDISRFKPKSDPPKTAESLALEASWGTADDGVAHALQALSHDEKRPDVLLSSQMIDPVFDEQDEVVDMLKSPRKTAHRMLREGYVMVPKPEGLAQWRWKKDGVVVRCSMAFVKQNFAGNAFDAVQACGRAELAKRLAAKNGGDQKLRAVPNDR
jgi:hypothetical protein